MYNRFLPFADDSTVVVKSCLRRRLGTESAGRPQTQRERCRPIAPLVASRAGVGCPAATATRSLVTRDHFVTVTVTSAEAVSTESSAYARTMYVPGSLNVAVVVAVPPAIDGDGGLNVTFPGPR